MVTPQCVFNDSEGRDIQLELNKLLNLGAILPCSLSSDQYLSKIFLIPKANGSKRFILNLKPLNKLIEKTHFKMEDYRTASKLIPKEGYMATIDLREAYLLVPISIRDRKYLRFQFKPRDSPNVLTYEFTAMPYGLSVAPWVFTKIMKEVMTFLRSKGHRSVVYLDDILCIGDSFEECADNVNDSLKMLACLGFKINHEKSHLTPQQTCKYLGFNFDSRKFTISLPDEKRINIAHLIDKFVPLPTCSIRDFAHLIGVLIAACPAIKYGYLYTKILERQKFLALQKSYDNYDAKISLSNVILQDLLWWKNNIFRSYISLEDVTYKYEIYTDASNSGWGAVLGTKKANGMWTETEKEYHINYLELLAVFLGLKCFVPKEVNCTILLRIDNTTAISYVNRMGGIQFPHLSNLARDIWQWCEKRNIYLYASYVNTKENCADAESRKVNPDIEWELSQSAFELIIQQLGVPEIDLFASRTNAKCEVYVAWKQDPDAIAVDAFTLNWHINFFYAFPPFSIILKCLRKIIHDQATGILVFPYWPSQPWFPLLKRLLISNIIFFKPSKDLLQSHFRAHHPLHANLTLGAAKLCGRRSSAVAHHQKQYL